jgi:hypothetical protein
VLLATVFASGGDGIRDASLYQRPLKSMQSVVGACMLFCGFTGMHSATLGNAGGWQLLALTSEMGSCMERSGLPVVDGE